jgi:hypothetical protein
VSPFLGPQRWEVCSARRAADTLTTASVRHRVAVQALILAIEWWRCLPLVPPLPGESYASAFASTFASGQCVEAAERLGRGEGGAKVVPDAPRPLQRLRTRQAEVYALRP